MEYKGIKLTLDMDNKKFNSAINRTIGTTKQLDNQLKALEKQLKFDPNNVQVYTQYIDKLQKKFESLEDVYAYLKSALDSTDVGTNQWVALEGALADVGKAMDIVNDKIEKADELFTSVPSNLSLDKVTFELDKQEKELDDNNNKWKVFDGAVGDVKTSFQNAEKNASIFFENLKANLVSNAITGGLKLLKNLVDSVWEGIKNLGHSYENLMKQGIEYNQVMQSYEVSLRAIAEGNGEATESADELIARMKEIGTRSAFSSNALLEAAQQLTASGISMEEAGNDIENLQKILAYAGKGDDELTRMAQNLNQIKNNSKATATDLRQFAYAGVPVYKLLADYSSEFNEITKDTVVQYDDLVNAFKVAEDESSQYFYANEIQLATFGGQVTQMQSQWQMLLGYMAQDTTGVLAGEVLPAVNEFLTNMIQAFTGEDGGTGGMPAVVEAFESGIEDLLDTLLSSDIVGKFLDGAAYIIDALSRALDDPEIQDKITALITDFTDLIVKFITDNMDNFIDMGIEIGEAIFSGIVKGLARNDFAENLGVYGGPVMQLLGYVLDELISNYWSGGFGDLSKGNKEVVLNSNIVFNSTQPISKQTATIVSNMVINEIDERLGGLIN